MSEWIPTGITTALDDATISIAPRFENKRIYSFWTVEFHRGSLCTSIYGEASDDEEAKKTSLVALEHIRVLASLSAWRLPYLERKDDPDKKVNLADCKDGYWICRLCRREVEDKVCLHTAEEIREAFALLGRFGFERGQR